MTNETTGDLLPNLLIIVADQCRYDCIGYAGIYPVRTPHLDRLASEGVWFSEAYTPIPLCSPARQAFLNGSRPESFGGLWNYGLGLAIPALPPERFSWPRELAGRYASCYIGKWGVHPQHGPAAYGFDRSIGEQDYAAYRRQQGYPLPQANGYFGETDSAPLTHARTHWLARQASEQVSALSKSGRPWHVQLHFPEPHPPCRPSPPFAEMYDAQSVPMWHNFRDTFRNKPYIQKQQLYNWGVHDWDWEDWAPVAARYYGIISQMDDAVGLLLQTLEETGQADNTIVVFTADHGDLCGAHRMMDKHYVMYDDIVKVPFIVRWPNRAAAGRRCDAFVCPMLDLPPTFLEEARIGLPDHLHGRSLLALLSGETPAVWREEAVATYNGQQFGLYTQRMIRTRDWKYVWNTTDIDELYDLRQDPGELDNRIDDHSCKELVGELRRRLYDILLREQDGLVNNPWMRDQLLLNRKL